MLWGEVLEKFKMTDKIKFYGIFIIGLLLGIIVGYGAGVSWALNWGVEKAIIFAERQGIEISLNKQMLSTALFQYKNNIGGCLFTNNSFDLEKYEKEMGY